MVRALARPPVELRAVDIARCTQIARRRKLDMVAALAAAIESPQVPPEARERIRVVPQAVPRGEAPVDTIRPDLYVHRLIDRLGLRRQQLFAAQADVVQRLRALARFGELRFAFATPVAAGDRAGVRPAHRRGRRLRPARADAEEPGRSLRRLPSGSLTLRGRRRAPRLDHVYVLGLDTPGGVPPERVPDELLADPLPHDEHGRARMLAPGAVRRLHPRPRSGSSSAMPRPASRDQPAVAPAAGVERRRWRRGRWEEQRGGAVRPAEALHSTYRLLRDELLEGHPPGRPAASPSSGSIPASMCLTPSSATSSCSKLAALIARPEGPVAGRRAARRQLRASSRP